MAKELVVVGGPNGAGKTTFAEDYARRYGLRYIGADAIAAQIAPADPSSVRLAAGRMFFESLDAALNGSESFVVESTLSGSGFERTVRRARAMGFEVKVIYIFLNAADTCIDRVAERVRKGGHDVPEADVRRRFGRSLRNFWRIYRLLADRWLLVYNSGETPVDVAVGSGAGVSVREVDLYEQFLCLIEVNE